MYNTKLKVRDIEWLAQGHKGSKNKDLSPGPLSFRIYSLFIKPYQKLNT